MAKRVAIVGMWQETNVFSSRPTRLKEFEAFELLEGAEIEAHHKGTGSVIGGFLDGLDDNVKVLPLFSAGAWPAAPPDEATSTELLKRLSDALEIAGPVDGVLINLHGAMVAAAHRDMEFETLTRIRARYPDVPLMAVLDLHANMTPAASALCDVIVGYRTYPHVDMHACGTETAGYMNRWFKGERYVTRHLHLNYRTSPIAQGTAVEPMRGLLTRAEDRARSESLERISLLPGFPYSDRDRMGFGIIAVAEKGRVANLELTLEQTEADIVAHLEEFIMHLPSPADAVATAIRSGKQPIVLADIADNIGGGSPGDGTVLLQELMDQRVGNSLVVIADSHSAALCHACGVGTELDLMIGGKSDTLHGKPVQAPVSVLHLGDGEYVAQGSYMTGQRFSMGKTALVTTPEGVHILVTSRATPPFHIEQLTSMNINPATFKVIVAKGAVAWRAAYESLIADAILVDTPGCCPADPFRLDNTDGG